MSYDTGAPARFSPPNQSYSSHTLLRQSTAPYVIVLLPHPRWKTTPIFLPITILILMIPHLSTRAAYDRKVIPVARDPPEALEWRGCTPGAVAPAGGPPAQPGRMSPTTATAPIIIVAALLVLSGSSSPPSPSQAGDKHRLRRGVPRFLTDRSFALLSPAGQVHEARERGVRSCSSQGVSR